MSGSRFHPQTSPQTLEHGIAAFFDQVIKTLTIEQTAEPLLSRVVSGNAGYGSTSEVGDVAMLHGRDSFALGFTLEQVVRDYGDVRQAVTSMAFETGASITVDEFRTFNRCLDNAIASAVTEYSAQKTRLATEANFQTLSSRLGTLAHELRNCLQTASLAFKVIKSGTVSTSGATADVVDRSLVAMTNLVDRSIAEVRITAGLVPRRDTIHLAKFLAEVQTSASLGAISRGISFTVSPVADDIVVYADPEMLAAALGNLLQNAFKFTKHGTQVHLRAQVVSDRVLIDVEDRCGGLPTGTAERLFMPFAQSGEDRSGLGLGLDISRRSVEANNGVLSVRDVPRIGCIFTIDLPRWQNAANA